MILTAWCYLKLTVTKTNLMELKENKTAALLGEEDSLEMKDKVFDLVLLCPFISSDDVDQDMRSCVMAIGLVVWLPPRVRDAPGSIPRGVGALCGKLYVS